MEREKTGEERLHSRKGEKEKKRKRKEIKVKERETLTG